MAHFSKNKEINTMIKGMVNDGWRYRIGGRHNKIVSPSGMCVIVPITPSDYRAFYNFRSHIRRINNLSRRTKIHV